MLNLDKKTVRYMLKHDYITHAIGCNAGRYHSCMCGHVSTQHFMEQPNKLCAHCECKKFTNHPCTCGLTEFLGKMLKTRS